MKYERITKPIDEDNFGGLSKIEVTRKLYRAYSKLVKIEDIEEELGIELVTLFKALDEGFYDRNGRYVDAVLYCGLSGWYLCDIRNLLGDRYFLKDYGVTWALKKSELEEG